jgi:cell division inhibitor SepF
MSIWERILGGLGFLVDDKEEQMEPNPGERQFWKKDNVVSFPSSGDNYRLVAVTPENFGEVEKMGEQLKKKRTLVVNFENMDAEEAKRTVDFLSGVIFALNGSLQKISQEIFVFAPAGVALNSDFQTRLSEREPLLRENDE